MACRFLYTNYWDAMTLTASSEETNLPATNTQHRWPTRVWRSTTVATTQYIQGDYGSNIGATCAVIKNNNFSASATVKVQAHDFVVTAPILSGSELVTNGAFTTDTTGWTVGNLATLASVAGGVSGNCLRVTENGAANPYATQTVSGLTVNNVYEFSFYVKAGTGANFCAYATCNAVNYGVATGRTAPAGWTQYKIVFKAGATSAIIVLQAIVAMGSGLTQLFDSVSFQNVTNTPNNLIDIVDTDTYEYWAYIAAGTYTGTTLATAVHDAIEAVCADNYTVSYSASASQFTIANGVGNFTLKWNTGLSKDYDASDLLAFSDAGDDSGAATYTSDNSTWDDPTFSATLTTIDNDTMVSFFGATQTYRLWRVTVTDTTNSDGYIEIGRVYIGTYFEPTRTFLEGYAETRNDLSALTKSEGGQISTIVRNAYSEREYTFITTEKASLDAVFTSRGLARGWFFCEDPTNAPQTTMRYVRIVGWSWSNQTGSTTYGLGLTLEDLL